VTNPDFRPEAKDPSAQPSSVSFGKLFRHSATIPCLSLLEARPRGQQEIVHLLRNHFAPNTVLGSLHLLVEEGLVTQSRKNGRVGGVAYECTVRGRAIANLPLKAVVDLPEASPSIDEGQNQRRVFPRVDSP